MKISLFEHMMNELDRQVASPPVSNKNLDLELLRRLALCGEPRPEPEASFYEVDDPLFDNVPI